MQTIQDEQIVTNIQSAGDQLLCELKARGITQKELSDAIDKPAVLINEIINGSRRLSAETSSLIGVALGMDSDYWLNIQSHFEIEQKKLESDFSEKLESIRVWNRLKEIVKVSYLKKRLGATNGTVECVKKIFEYFGVCDIDEFEQKASNLSAAYFRKSDKSQIDPTDLLTWILVTKHDSEAINCNVPYSKRHSDALVSDLNSVFMENNDTVARTKEILSKYGIKFLIEEKTAKLPVDGYSFWIGDNPTIALTRRYNRIDNFAFTVMHELGHIEKHLQSKGDDSIDISLTNDKDSQIENEANQYAIEKLFGNAPVDELFTRCRNPYSSGNYIQEFSAKYKIHPSIIAGRYRHQFHTYSAFSSLIEPIK